MVHGDDQGLVLPPRLAPIHAVIVPIWKSDDDEARILEAARQLHQRLKEEVRYRGEPLRVHLDDRDHLTPGFKFNDWELRGVPVRIELGPKDLDAHAVTLARRDKPGREGKETVSMDALAERLPRLLDEIHESMYAKAKAFLEANIHEPETYDELKEIVRDGWALAWWCGNEACEDRIKEDTKATNRCLPLEQPGGEGRCVVCGERATVKAIFARAY